MEIERRQRSDSEISMKENESASKRMKMDSIAEEDFNFGKSKNIGLIIENCDEYINAVKVLEHQKEVLLMLVKSNYNMMIEDANKLAESEMNHIQEVFETQSIDIQKRILEDNQIKTRSMAAEGNSGDCILLIESKQRHFKSENQSSSNTSFSKSSFYFIISCLEDQCCFHCPLKEEEMIDDLLLMARSTKQLCDKYNLPPVCTAAPLSNNRLLLNDHVIYPNTPCSLRNGPQRSVGCTFVSTMVKEKEVKEKRKEPEVGMRREF